MSTDGKTHADEVSLKTKYSAAIHKLLNIVYAAHALSARETKVILKLFYLWIFSKSLSPVYVFKLTFYNFRR